MPKMEDRTINTLIGLAIASSVGCIAGLFFLPLWVCMLIALPGVLVIFYFLFTFITAMMEMFTLFVMMFLVHFKVEEKKDERDS